MSIKFLKDFSDKNIMFEMDAIINSSEDLKIEKLNDYQVMIIINGKRYDFDLKDVILL